jgi:spore coat protein U-like protein
MKRAFLLLAALLALAPSLANAAYSCTISSPGFVEAYDPNDRNTDVVATELTITCTRSPSDANTMSYSVQADNGLKPRGGNRNRASFGNSRMNYDLYQDGACGTQWGGNSRLSGTIDFAGSMAATENVPYWGCIPARQRGLRAGTYTDLVTMTLTYGPRSSRANGTLPVSISSPARCQLTTSPADIVFNYTDFGPAVNTGTTYGVTCTSYLPYGMALDAASGTLLGLDYTLSLEATDATGTGAEQTFAILGNMPSGQSGTCASATCSASQSRTLTITY